MLGNVAALAPLAVIVRLDRTTHVEADMGASDDAAHLAHHVGISRRYSGPAAWVVWSSRTMTVGGGTRFVGVNRRGANATPAKVSTDA